MAVEQAFSRTQGGLPDRTLQQRMAGLDKANVTRGFRATLKKDLKAKRANVLEYLLEPPELISSMKVFDLLMSTPKYGRVKVNQLLRQCRISPSKTIGGLSLRQRTEIVSMLRR